jgi:hypothetical protein
MCERNHGRGRDRALNEQGRDVRSVFIGFLSPMGEREGENMGSAFAWNLGGRNHGFFGRVSWGDDEGVWVRGSMHAMGMRYGLDWGNDSGSWVGWDGMTL